MRWIFLFLLSAILFGAVTFSDAQSSFSVQVIAHDLLNPRGVAIYPDGRLLVVETGRGSDISGFARDLTGRISEFNDLNGDGDFDDDGERTVIVSDQPSYNSLREFKTGHDEPFGLSDIVLMANGDIFFAKDDPFAQPRNRGTEGFYGETGIYSTETGWNGFLTLIDRPATLNSFAYDADRDLFFVAESGFNRIISVTPEGEIVHEIPMPMLASDQQPVPAGLALDPTTGDVLVALFSGFVYSYNDTPLSFMPGDSKIVRVDPDAGTVSDAVTGLTTAIDVTVDENGNIYTAELTTQWPLPLMPFDLDLFDPEQPPDPGGYARDSGRITRHAPDGSASVVLADGIDTPTNLVYSDGFLIVSSGMGTPGRAVLTPSGIEPIEGKLLRIAAAPD